MWSWVAHRVTGVLIFFFLFAHVLDTALVRVSPDSYNRIMDTYKTPLVNLMEVGLVGAVPTTRSTACASWRSTSGARAPATRSR